MTGSVIYKLNKLTLLYYHLFIRIGQPLCPNSLRHPNFVVKFPYYRQLVHINIFKTTWVCAVSNYQRLVKLLKHINTKHHCYSLFAHFNSSSILIRILKSILSEKIYYKYMLYCRHRL